MASKDFDIDFSISSIWEAWQAFIVGKRDSPDVVRYKYQLSRNLLGLSSDLQQRVYKHGKYHTFTLYDPKRREIAVASVNDRVVHRLLYDYLVPIWDKSFCFDAWSCRKNKGLHGAIARASQNFTKYKDGWLWRSDILKFFDNIDHLTLKRLLRTKLDQQKVLALLDEVIDSYQHVLASQPARVFPLVI